MTAPLPRRALFRAMRLAGLIGAGVVLAAHLCERLHLLMAMGWGRPDSTGHYLDLAGAVVALTALPIGTVGPRLLRRGRTAAAPITPLDGPNRSA